MTDGQGEATPELYDEMQLRRWALDRAISHGGAASMEWIIENAELIVEYQQKALVQPAEPKQRRAPYKQRKPMTPERLAQLRAMSAKACAALVEKRRLAAEAAA